MNFEDLKKIYLFSLSHFFRIPFVNPDYVGILLTNRCNLKCKMCDIRKNPTTPEEELSFDEIKNIVDDIADWGVRTVTLSGGEPFLRKDFFKIANYTMSKVQHTAVNTNLTLIDENIAEKICNLPHHRFHLEISLDGATPETHDNIRGTAGTFDNIIKGIKLIREISKKKETDVHIGVTTVVMEENVQELLDLINLAERFNFVNVSIMPVLLSNKDVQERGNEPYMEKDKLKILDDTIDEVIRFKEKKGLIINPVSSLKLYKQYFRGKLFQRQICNAGYMGPNIVVNGNVIICIYTIGNIREKGIQELWYSKKARQIRQLTAKCNRPCLQHYSIRFQEANPLKATYSYFKEKICRKF